MVLSIEANINILFFELGCDVCKDHRMCDTPKSDTKGALQHRVLPLGL